MPQINAKKDTIKLAYNFYSTDGLLFSPFCLLREKDFNIQNTGSLYSEQEITLFKKIKQLIHQKGNSFENTKKEIENLNMLKSLKKFILEIIF